PTTRCAWRSGTTSRPDRRTATKLLVRELGLVSAPARVAVVCMAACTWLACSSTSVSSAGSGDGGGDDATTDGGGSTGAEGGSDGGGPEATPESSTSS